MSATWRLPQARRRSFAKPDHARQRERRFDSARPAPARHSPEIVRAWWISFSTSSATNHLVVLRHMPQLGQRLEALEHQFDLPSQAIPLQHVRGGKGRLGKGRITYSANRRVAGCTPLRAASRRTFWCARRTLPQTCGARRPGPQCRPRAAVVARGRDRGRPGPDRARRVTDHRSRRTAARPPCTAAATPDTHEPPARSAWRMPRAVE